MNPTTRTASSVFPTAPDKRARIDITSITLPADILRLIFGFCPPRSIIRCRQVCQRWRAILDDGATLKALIPKISQVAFGARFSCCEFIKFANRYTSGLPKLDLSGMEPIYEADVTRLQPEIQNLVLRTDSVFFNTQFIILTSKMAKRNATLKLKLGKDAVRMDAVFETLRLYKVQLKKLTIHCRGQLHGTLNVRESFIRFVNEGGLCQRYFKLSLQVDWFAPNILTCFKRNGICFSKLKLHVYGWYITNDFHRYLPTETECMNNGLLEAESEYNLTAEDNIHPLP